MRHPIRRLTGAAAFAVALALSGTLFVGGVPSADAEVVVDPPANYGDAPDGGGGALASNVAGTVVGGANDVKGRAYQFFPGAPAALLGEPAGGPPMPASLATDVNAADVVVGAAGLGSAFQAAIWVPSSSPAFLSFPAGVDVSEAEALNDAGVIVGWGYDEGAPSIVPLLWPPGDPPVLLDSVGQPAAIAMDVNGSGIAVGYAGGLDQSDAFSPVVWVPGEAAEVLPTLGGTQAFATGINDAGEVVGLSTTSGDADVHLFRWSIAGGMEDLGTPGSGSGFPVAWRWDDVPVIQGPKINNGGHVATFALSGSAVTALAWVESDGFTVLPPFPGGTQAWATNIDDADRVVGGADDGGGSGSAAIWQLQVSEPPTPPEPGPPAPEPDPDAGGGGAGSGSTDGTNSGGSAAANATGSVPTLPATGPGTIPVLVALATVLLVAGGALAAGRRFASVRQFRGTVRAD